MCEILRFLIRYVDLILVLNQEASMSTLEVRRSHERGYADHGWLKSFHSFSFADYFDPQHVEFGPLRVINEDRVQAGAGFGTHGHRDMEIISYVLSGELAHQDSMGNGSTIRPGDVQRMSAGAGIRHSEFNPSRSAGLHFLQIWITPSVYGIAPGYEEKRFAVTEKRGRLRLIASPDRAEGSVLIHQDARVYAGLFDGAEQATLAIDPARRLYVHLARGVLRANGVALEAGDALKLAEVPALTLDQGRDAEVLVFDLPGSGTAALTA
jgi:redox-sensitive bicupin YhaK (pirin superfamily)